MAGKAVGGTTPSVSDSNLALGFESGSSFFHFSHDYNMISTGALDTTPSLSEDGIEFLGNYFFYI